MFDMLANIKFCNAHKAFVCWPVHPAKGCLGHHICAFHATNGPVWSFDIKAYLEGIYIGYHFSNPEPDENVFILETLSNTIGECQDHMFGYLPTSSVHGGYEVAPNYMQYKPQELGTQRLCTNSTNNQ